MSDPGLIDALNDSINRLASGENVAACLRFHQQYATELEPLLETGQLVRRVQSSLEEARQAQERHQFRFEQALTQPLPRPEPIILKHLAQLVASLIVILSLFASGTGLLAENGLPGDTLYGVKLFTETIRLSLTNQDENLQAIFAQRRIDEAQQITQLKREVELTFAGIIDDITADGFIVEGLLVTTDSLPERDLFLPGNRIEVQAMSNAQGQLSAMRIRLLDEPVFNPETNVTVPQAEATSPPTINPTRPATATPIMQASEPVVADTRQPTATRPDQNSRPTETQIDQRPSVVPTDTPMDCVTSPPSGWITYTIQPGDNLSQLASGTGGSLGEIARVNCIKDTQLVVVGQTIYLPRQPSREIDAATATQSSRPTPTAQPTPGRDGDGQRDGGDRPQQTQESDGGGDRNGGRSR